MADGKKYKLGDLEFESEQEYREAAGDLKRIKSLMAKYDVSDPGQARRILASIKAHPQTFRSPYGKKFIEKLEKASASMDALAFTAEAESKNQQTGRREAQQRANSQSGFPKEKQASGQRVKEKKPRKQREPRADGQKKEKLQIFTVRNFVIGIVVIVGIVAFSLAAPRLFSLNDGADNNNDIKRTMVTAYAKGQADLKSQLYTYYFNVVGEAEEEAKKDAEEAMKKYVMDLSDRTISAMADSEIKDVYQQLVDGGDIQNNSFVEPAAITVLKEKLQAAGLANQTGNGVEGETAIVAAVNNMMDYQERLYYSLCRNYSLLNDNEDDCEAYANEDLTAMFGDVVYDFKMSEDDKKAYYESFVKKGLIKDNQVVRFSTDPTAYNLPDLTPAIEVTIKGGAAKAYRTSMISYAPAASVFYEIGSDKEKGYICFRNNGDKSKYIQLDEDTSVTAQGDFFILIGDDSYSGDWFYNKQDIGLLMNGDKDSKISYVYDLTY